MRIYYHLYPACPNCHEPHVNGSPLERIDNENLKCSSCGAYFRSRIDLFSSDRFENTVEAVINKEGKKAEDYLSGLPLIWEIQENLIEREYIRWVDRTERGKFLITWPWKEVKFIPLLVSEYLLNNPTKKVVVVGDISSDSSGETEIVAPRIKDIFDNLIYLEGLERNDIDESIKKETKRFDRRFVLQKRKVIHNVIHRIGTHYRVEEVCDQNFTKCRSRLIREIKEDYGEESIRKIDERKMKGESIIKRVKTLNPDGFIDIKLEEREQWMGELRYKKEWLWKVLLNSEKITRLNRMIPTAVLKDSEESDESDKRLFLVSSEMSPNTIFNLVKKTAPDLVVIENADDFMKDVIYGGEKSVAFFSFLKDCVDSPVLMFSTDPDVRHLYGINRTEKYVSEYSITPHTWDFEILIERIRAEWENHESNYSNPVSSRWEELSEGGRIPEVEYIEIKTLDDLDVFLDRISSILVDESVKRDIRKYIYDLKRSPLFIRGDYEKTEVFRRRGNFLETVHYDYLMSLIHERTDDREFKSLKGLISRIYHIESADTINPLMKEITGKAGDLLKEKDNFITVVVHGYDVKGTEKLLREMGFDEYMPQRLSVCSWRNLSQRERDIADNARHYVISTLPPSLAYSIYSGHVKKFVFIGSGNNVKKIETIVKNRLTETISRPIYLIHEGDSAPELLKTALKNVEIPSNEVLQNISDEIIVEFDENLSHISDTSHLKTEGSHPYINSGEHVILVVDINGKGMFIPSGASLFIKGGHRPVEILLDNISSDRDLKTKLENKEMLVDRHGIYISFRSIFIKFMMVYGKKVIFRKGPYEWNGFHSLFNDAIGWILILEKAVRGFSYKNEITSEEAEKKFAEYLSSLNLTAKNPDYIKGWWSNHEIVTTEYGAYPLYEVEHPRSLDDVRKIYVGINDIQPEMMLDPADAEKSYIASITIQNFRRSLLKEDIKAINPSLHQLYTRLEKEIKSIVETSPVFKVNLVYDVEIIKDVEPFRVMDEYQEYVRTPSNV